MCELDSAAIHHKGTWGRQRLAPQMFSILIFHPREQLLHVFLTQLRRKKRSYKAEKDLAMVGELNDQGNVLR